MEKSHKLCYNCKLLGNNDGQSNSPEYESADSYFSTNKDDNSNSFSWKPFDFKTDNSKILEIFKPLEDLSNGLSVMNDIKTIVDTAAHQIGNKFKELSRAVSGIEEESIDKIYEKSSATNMETLKSIEFPEDIIFCSSCKCLSSADSDSLCRDYLIIQHGMMDSPLSLVNISFAIIRDNPHLNIYLPSCNYLNTYMGIDPTSYILGHELIKWFESIHFDIGKDKKDNDKDDINILDTINISMIGHSLGSLMLLGALDKLEDSMSLVSSGRIKFLNFIGVASPFFGVYENSAVLKSTFSIFNTDVLKDLDHRTNALIKLFTYNVPKLLLSFDRVIMYGNAKNDRLVGPRTSLSLPVNLYNNDKFANLVNKCMDPPNTYIYIPNNYKFVNEFCSKIVPKLNKPIIQDEFYTFKVDSSKDTSSKYNSSKNNSSDTYYEIVSCNEDYTQVVESNKELLIEYLNYLKEIVESKSNSLFGNDDVQTNSCHYYFIELELFEAVENATKIKIDEIPIKPSAFYQLLIAFFELITSINSNPATENFKFENMNHLHFNVLMTLFIIKDYNKKTERYMVYIPTINPHRHIICKNSFMIVSESFLSLAKHLKTIKCFDKNG